MDRALWKAKRKTDGKIDIGYLVQDKYLSPQNNTSIENEFLHVVSAMLVEIDPSTLCQCTGLKDKNGVLIFEGDEIRVWGGEYFYGYWEHDSTYFVKSDLHNQYTNAFAFGESEFVELTGKNINDKEE